MRTHQQCAQVCVLIISVDSQPTHSITELSAAIKTHQPGDTVILVIGEEKIKEIINITLYRTRRESLSWHRRGKSFTRCAHWLDLHFYNIHQRPVHLLRADLGRRLHLVHLLSLMVDCAHQHKRCINEHASCRNIRRRTILLP